MTRLRSVLAATLIGVVILALPAAAQVEVPTVPGGGSSPAPSPQPSPEPTKRLPDPDPEPEPEPQPTQTRRPPSTGGGGSTGGTSGTSGGSSSTGTSTGTSTGSGDGRTGAPGTAPAQGRRVYGPKGAGAAPIGAGDWATRPKTPAHTTTRLLDLIDTALPAGGEASLVQRTRVFGRFPVIGYVWYQDDYGAPRYYGGYHPHEGTDMFARGGTPVIATVDGVIMKWATGGGGGSALWLMGDDDVRYYYGHLGSFAPGANTIGLRVRMGQVIGTVGASGASATGTAAHVHFEIAPGGLASINPKPILDAWLRQAEERAAIAAGILSGPDTFSPSSPGRWAARLGLAHDAASTSQPPLWVAGFGGTTTVAFADLALTDLMAREELSIPRVGADGPARGDFRALLDPAGAQHQD